MTLADSFADLFAPIPVEVGACVQGDPWKVLLVDDEPDVHAALRLALHDVRVEERPLELMSAYSAAEAKARLAADPDIALLLLDVVMESERAGLELVRHVRRVLGNRSIKSSSSPASRATRRSARS